MIAATSDEGSFQVERGENRVVHLVGALSRIPLQCLVLRLTDRFLTLAPFIISVAMHTQPESRAETEEYSSGKINASASCKFSRRKLAEFFQGSETDSPCCERALLIVEANQFLGAGKLDGEMFCPCSREHRGDRGKGGERRAFKGNAIKILRGAMALDDDNYSKCCFQLFSD